MGTCGGPDRGEAGDPERDPTCDLPYVSMMPIFEGYPALGFRRVWHPADRRGVRVGPGGSRRRDDALTLERADDGFAMLLYMGWCRVRGVDGLRSRSRSWCGGVGWSMMVTLNQTLSDKRGGCGGRVLSCTRWRRFTPFGNLAMGTSADAFGCSGGSGVRADGFAFAAVLGLGRGACGRVGETSNVARSSFDTSG
jgi:hypothetical protein